MGSSADHRCDGPGIRDGRVGSLRIKLPAFIPAGFKRGRHKVFIGVRPAADGSRPGLVNGHGHAGDCHGPGGVPAVTSGNPLIAILRRLRSHAGRGSGQVAVPMPASSSCHRWQATLCSISTVSSAGPLPGSDRSQTGSGSGTCNWIGWSPAQRERLYGTGEATACLPVSLLCL